MRRLGVLFFVLAACSAGGDTSTTTAALPSTSSTVEETTTTTRPVQCAEPPYRVEVLPERVEPTIVDPDDLERNDYLEVAGTSSTIWLDSDGDIAVTLIRGTLPLEMWPGDSGRVSIDGADARVGPFEDGSWVVGWAEPPGERCDQFTMVFFPPIDAAEVEATLASMDRTAG
ncbi:MAG: hypothetical protein WD156_05800 [Acidimicrobiia bacterium]